MVFEENKASSMERVNLPGNGQFAPAKDGIAPNLLTENEYSERGRTWRAEGDAVEHYTKTIASQLARVSFGCKSRRARF